MQVCSHLLHAHRFVHVPFGVWDCRDSGPCSHLPLRDSTAKSRRTCTFWKVAPSVFELAGIAAVVCFQITLLRVQCICVGMVHAGVGLLWISVPKYLLSNWSRLQWWSCLPLYQQQHCHFSLLPQGAQYPVWGRQGGSAAGSVYDGAGVGLFPEEGWAVQWFPPSTDGSVRSWGWERGKWAGVMG